MAARLTDVAVRNARPRAKKYRLSAGGGLNLLVMPDGAKYWRFRYRSGKKQKELSVGEPYPQTSLRQAEAEAGRLRTELLQGTDPAEGRLVARLAGREKIAGDFGEAAESWFAFRSRAWSAKSSGQVRDYLDKDILPKLARRPLDRINAPELGAIVSDIEDREAFDVAKKARQWLKSIYSYSRAKGWTTTDPAKDLDAVAVKGPGVQNYPHVPIEELGPLMRGIDTYSGSFLVRSCAWMTLWTANRPGVTRMLRWKELDLDDALWTIQRDREGMKRGYFHMTPLPKQAVALLREVHKRTGSYEYVFIGRNDPSKSLSDGAVNGMLLALGYRGKQTGAGFRHVVSTALNELGYETDWVERQLAHGDPDKIRGTYNKAMYLKPRRKMVQDWADYLDALKRGEDPKDVLDKVGPEGA
ncbi:MAG: putative prophage integrase [Nevskia sp.]|nr:putative prophage integrase [Nevskia sp.]